jgi:anaphase-promoting complex subunit 2
MRLVREYLCDREDTVRCIISSMMDEESGGELYEELRRQDVKPLEEAQLDEEEDEEMPTFDWMPPPLILQRRGVISGKIGESGFQLETFYSCSLVSTARKNSL